MSFTLFENQTADGDSAEFVETAGGWRQVEVTGDFGGGTVTFQVRHTSADFSPLEDGVLSAPTSKKVYMKPGTRLKLTVAGSTTPDISAYLL